MPRTLWSIIVPLSLVWTAGFVLFNASASRMSPAVVSLVRCMEPLATVAVGFLIGERYSWRVLVTLIPICGGVALASFRGGVLSAAGICLALLSNVSFCGRPFFTQQLKLRKSENPLDDLGVFFNVTFVATLTLPVFVFLFEGTLIQSAVQRLSEEGVLVQFGADMMMSSIFFFLYQFIQLMLGFVIGLLLLLLLLLLLFLLLTLLSSSFSISSFS
ncbi:unnamed protein product [Polarella glacialis]|uniref:Sugar phosphate transporter domain-containing protein n=1 Tax=Polarella glacialis TaxID=89957 RepID=A0A813HSA5_POLGL|nr:unnamed protein product [Polarella glacialis]CAE8695734.1 unnamed protein product [Polarella glacialis]